MNVTANCEFRIIRYVDVDQRRLLSEICVDVAQYLCECDRSNGLAGLLTGCSIGDAARKT